MGGLFGIGGGLIAIPVLGLWFGLDQQLAQGTALVMSVPNVLLALYRYQQAQSHRPASGITAGADEFLLCVAGGDVRGRAGSAVIRWGFVAFLLAITLYNLIKMYTSGSGSITGSRYGWPWFGRWGH
jgi:uncharacterized protein